MLDNDIQQEIMMIEWDVHFSVSHLLCQLPQTSTYNSYTIIHVFRYHIIANPTVPLGIILQNSKSQLFKINFSPTWSMHSPRRERKMVVASGHAEYNAEYCSEYHDEYHGGNHDEYHTEYWAEYRGEYHGEYHGGLWACCPLLPSQLTYFRFLRSLMIHTMMAVLLLLRKIKDLHMETKFSHHKVPFSVFLAWTAFLSPHSHLIII